MSKNQANVVIVDFDRPRELKLTFSAMEALSATDDLDLDNLDFNELDLQRQKKFLFYALQYDARKHNEKLTMDKLNDILDEAVFIDVIEGLFAALNAAVSPTKKQQSNQGGSNEGKK